jgi:hypothetical protein
MSVPNESLTNRIYCRKELSEYEIAAGYDSNYNENAKLNKQREVISIISIYTYSLKDLKMLRLKWVNEKPLTEHCASAFYFEDPVG